MNVKRIMAAGLDVALGGFARAFCILPFVFCLLSFPLGRRSIKLWDHTRAASNRCAFYS
jgi:hypothetical protein